MRIAAHITGIIAMIFSVLSYQFKTKKQILIAQMLCVIFFTLNFSLLYFSGTPDALTGAALNVVCIIRNCCYMVCDQKDAPPKIRIAVTVFYMLVMLAVGIYTWNSIVSLLFIITMLLNTLAFSMKEPQKVRLIMLISAPFAFSYDLLSNSIGGMINEAFSAVSTVIALIRYRKK